MNIVVLDGGVVNPGDLSWDPIAQHGALKVYDFTSDEDKVDKAKNADIILSNKSLITRELMSQLPKLKLICVLATGYNNVDVDAAKELGITVCNAVGYGSTSVAQHVFALILEFTNMVGSHTKSVNKGGWTAADVWCYWDQPMIELADKTIGIYGLGKIGSKVADIALAFDMKVLATHKHPIRDQRDGVTFVDIETLCRDSDFISLHAPLSDDNKGIVDSRLLSLMKSSAVLINTGRGGLINELDLKQALENKTIKGAGLDVISTEPPPIDHPLIGLPNCLVTPHHAWAAKNSRQRLINIVGQNIEAFVNGTPQNEV